MSKIKGIDQARLCIFNLKIKLFSQKDLTVSNPNRHLEELEALGEIENCGLYAIKTGHRRARMYSIVKLNMGHLRIAEKPSTDPYALIWPEFFTIPNFKILNVERHTEW